MKKKTSSSSGELMIYLKLYKKTIRNVIIAVLCVWLVIYLEFHFLFITGLSRSKMEKMYDIKVTDSISLKRYKKELVFRDGMRYHLYVGGIKDIHEFLYENCGGKKTSYLFLTKTGEYKYSYTSEKGKEIDIIFYEEKGGYEAEFILYE